MQPHHCGHVQSGELLTPVAEHGLFKAIIKALCLPLNTGISLLYATTTRPILSGWLPPISMHLQCRLSLIETAPETH